MCLHIHYLNLSSQKHSEKHGNGYCFLCFIGMEMKAKAEKFSDPELTNMISFGTSHVHPTQKLSVCYNGANGEGICGQQM